MHVFNPFVRDPRELLLEAVQLLEILPLQFLARVHAKLLTRKFQAFMPTNPLAVTFADPITALVIAVLDFLSTPEGQLLCGDLRTVTKDFVLHVHAQLPVAPPVSSAPVAVKPV